MPIVVSRAGELNSTPQSTGLPVFGSVDRDTKPGVRIGPFEFLDRAAHVTSSRDRTWEGMMRARRRHNENPYRIVAGKV